MKYLKDDCKLSSLVLDGNTVFGRKGEKYRNINYEVLHGWK